ncbi:MAG TPA: SPOR domain-containing protein [Steroidobacteraceae bacterium]|nr:SPOR domain-containing protein [Steroidobacteraceae bacterium]
MHARRALIAVCASVVIGTLLAACDARQSDWESARKADTAEAYGEFLKRYPQGDFVQQARARLDDLKVEADWQAAVASDSAVAYQQFVERHPDGARADEARIRVENLTLAAAPVEAPPPAVAAAGIFRVQLGAFGSETRARSVWQGAVKTHAAQLAGLGYSVDPAVVGTATLYRLQTSTVTESRARAICDELKAAQQPCVVVLP